MSNKKKIVRNRIIYFLVLPPKSSITLYYWVKNVIIKHTKDILVHKRYFFSSAPNVIILVPSGRDILGATVSAMDEWIDNGLEK